MTKKWILQNVVSKKVFIGAGFDGPYFSNEEKPRYFDTEEEAVNRLKEESELFPSAFKRLALQISQVYTFE
jgi:hypothetical protein